MSLRIFHIIFVAASVVLSLFVAMWAFREYNANGGSGTVALGAIFLLAAGALVVYGRRVYRKLSALP